MATANPTADIELEEYEEYREQREILSQSFSEVRQRLDERELELSSQLEKLFRENLRIKRVMSSDRYQLMNAMEHLKSTLTSDTLSDTSDEATQPIQNKIKKLEESVKTLRLNWFPQKLYQEIKSIGVFQMDSTIPSYDQQRTDIHSLMNLALQDGQSWYLIHIRWFKQWKKYVGYDNWDRSDAGNVLAKPGPIDNTPLLEDGKLKRTSSGRN